MMSKKVRSGKTDARDTQMKSSKVAEQNKSDIKPADKAQPTAEQMRIAQIIDTKVEDPTLKDKIKQVMDATQKSEDEVCTALHDCDNDPDRAVTLLLEGMQTQWAISSKKKKRTPEKLNKEQQPPLDEDWDADLEERERDRAAAQIIGNTGKPQNRTGGPLSRTVDRQWRGRDNGESDKGVGRGRGRGRLINGPNTRSTRIGTYFVGGTARGRGRGKLVFHKPIETWEAEASSNSHAPSQQPPSGVQGLEDWDNEEYTGSLADSKVFTPSSSSGDSPPQQDTESSHEDPVPSDSPDEVGENLHQSLSAAQFLSQFSSNQPSKSLKTCSVFHEPHFSRAEMTPTPPFSCGYGVVFDSSEQTAQDDMLSRRPPLPYGRVNRARTGYDANQMHKIINPDDVRLPRGRGPRPRIPPPSKIPSSAVEMPPDAVGSSMDLLDFQFGALEFADAETVPSQAGPISPIRCTPSSASPESADKLLSSQQGISATESSLLISDPSFSPVRSVSNAITPISELTSKSGESVTSGLYQDTVVYQTSQFSKSNHQPQAGSYSSAYSNTQATTSSGMYSLSNSANYSSSSVGNYNNSTSSYPQYQGYPNYPSQSQPMQMQQMHSSTSYQGNVNSQYGGSSVYGSSGMASTNSYTAPYQTYTNSNQHSHKSSLSSVNSSNKEFDSSTPSVNLTTITQTSAINATQSLLSSTPSTSATKPTAMSSISKSAVVPANMPTGGVPPIVGAQYIMSQTGVPYFQQPLYSYEELQLMSQQRLPHLPAAYYELGYQTPTTREGVQYNLSDARFARADNNTSPVSSITQQSGTQAHQQPLMNPAAMPPAYAYFYGGSVIPGNFQYGAPTIYPVAATGTGSGHTNNSSVYGKGPTSYSGGYGGSYDGSQASAGDYKGGSQVPKTQPPQSNPSTSSDITMYTKSHGALSKSYDKQGYCPTPPPFTLGSQNSGIGPGGGYAQHLFIPAMTPHHNTPLMHQPMHQEGASSVVSGRSQVGNQSNKVGNKSSYSPSTYWTQN